MKGRLGILLAACAGAACAYTYDVQGCITNPDDGDVTCSVNGNLLYTWSKIYYGPITFANPNDYEVMSQISISSGGGTVMQFLRANSSSVIAGYGSYVSVELDLSSWTPYGASIPVTVKQSTNGTVTQLGSTAVSGGSSMIVRSVIWGSNLWVFVNGSLAGTFTVSPTTGMPGYGGTGSPSAGMSFSVGHHDTVAPGTVPTNIPKSVYSSSLSFRWQGVTDDTSGTGVYRYEIYRNGSLIGYSDMYTTIFVDKTANPGTAYTYGFDAVDYHGNASPVTTLSLTAPPSTAVDPRRPGVRSDGAYWGGGGEQIDMESGNLNFSLPLVTAQGRAGWKVPLFLSYNSQNWRQDSDVNWQLGFDVGYGFGWRLLIGSITPYYANWTSGVDHYTFTDGTGAEYRLDVNSGGVWSSTQPGQYLWFDANAGILHFKDGTFWVMGCTSGGVEGDAGSLYPTTIEDVHGNQVNITYDTGIGLPYNGTSGVLNSSSRILLVMDGRAQQCGWSSGCGNSTPLVTTYYFTYSGRSYAGTAIPHLSSIGNLIGDTATYTLGYTSGSLGPPFGTDSNYSGLTTSRLTSIAVPAAGTYTFSYDTAGAAELAQVTFPWGGHLKWAYSTDTYSNGRSLRAVTSRILAADSLGAVEWAYPITRDSVSGSNLHGTATLSDASGVGLKTWNFTTTGSAWQLGLTSEFIQKASASGALYTDDTYTWLQDPSGHPYVSAKVSVTDPGTGNAQSAKTTETLDQYGNVTQAVIYPYNNTTTALKTYDSTFITDSAYVSNYIRNRLLTTTLTMGSTVKTLAQKYYDGKAFGGEPSFPANAPSLCSSKWGSYWTPPTSGQITVAMDQNPPIPYNMRGSISASVNPGSTSCMYYYVYGTLELGTDSTGKSFTQNADSSTNYMAPTTISTQSYGETIGYNSWLGVTSTTGWNGESLSMSYDSWGRPVSGQSAYGAVTSFAYNTAPLPQTQTKTGPDGFTRTTLDGLGRTIKTERGFTSTNLQSEVDTVYAPCACSPLGKLKSVTAPFPSGGTAAGSTVYTYDGIGRTVSVVQPDGQSATHYSYSGNQTTVTDPAANWKTFTNDVEGNLISVVEPDPSNQPGGTLTTTYTYDWMKHLTGVSMTRGGVTQTRAFVYDDLGRLTSATNPESGTVSYYYNSDNTLQYKHDAKGQDTVYTYGAQQRLAMVQKYPTGKNNAEDTCQRVTYTYDTNPVDGSFSQYSSGRLTTVSYGGCAGGHSWGATEMYSYHPAGAVTAKQLRTTKCGTDSDGNFACPPASMEVDYGYDGMGQVWSVKYPGAQSGFVYSSDGMGRHNGLTLAQAPDCLHDNPWNDTLVQNVTFDYAGRMTGTQFKVGQTSGSTYTWNDSCGGYGYYPTYTDVYETESRTYNTSGQLSTLAWSAVSSAQFSWAGDSISYLYSPTQNNGQITQMSDSLSGETVLYGYDQLKRLTASCSSLNGCSSLPNATTNFQYDGFGNLVSKTLNGTTSLKPVNGATNQLSSASYDLNGNMTSGSGVTLTYDVSNRVASSTPVSGGTEYYGYAADNKRVWRLTAAGAEEWTLYGAHGEKIGVYQWAGLTEHFNNQGVFTNDTATFTALRTSLWFDGKLISEAGQPVMTDRLGTNKATAARYYPYGEEITSTANDRVKFATYNRDGFTGLDYADQRYYASTYGRFNSPDRARNSVVLDAPGSWNRYA